MSRDQNILELRPTIHREVIESNSLEHFQNEVLRPILKFQHELLLKEWQSNPYFEKIKELQSQGEKRSQLAVLFSKNPVLFSRFIGMCVGLFSTSEFEFYQNEKSQIDKRLKELLLTRFLSYE